MTRKEILTEEEKEAMRATVRERKKGKANGLEDVLAAIEAMEEPDRSVGRRLHAIITKAAPGLGPKTWYGMPAYANADGKVVLFFRGAGKFKERYMTLGFNESARLDEGAMWPTSFALTSLTPADEKRIEALVARSVG